MTVTITALYQKEIDSATKIMFFLCNIFTKVFSVSECLLCKWIFPNLYGKQKEYRIKGNICVCEFTFKEMLELNKGQPKTLTLTLTRSLIYPYCFQRDNKRRGKTSRLQTT